MRIKLSIERAPITLLLLIDEEGLLNSARLRSMRQIDSYKHMAGMPESLLRNNMQRNSTLA